MSDLGTIAKIVMVLGIVFALANGVYGNVQGFANFENSLKGFPQFQSPIGQNYLSTRIIANATGTQAPVFGQVTGCANTSYWKCVSTNDGNASYLSLGSNLTNGTFNQFAVNMTLLQGDNSIQVQPLVASLYCRSNVTQQFRIFLTGPSGGYPTDDSYDFNCSVTADLFNSSFSQVNLALHAVCIGALPPGQFCGWNVTALANVTFIVMGWPDPANVLGETDFTFLNLDLYTNQQPPCTGNVFENTGCQISRFFTGIINALAFLANAVLFIFAIVAYIVGAIFAFLALLAFFFALPNTPIFVQALLDIFLVAALLLSVLTLLRIARGTSQ